MSAIRTVDGIGQDLKQGLDPCPEYAIHLPADRHTDGIRARLASQVDREFGSSDEWVLVEGVRVIGVCLG